MIARFSSIALLVMVFAMILLGGIVHGTGSSLACPDWPLCYGEAIPVMKGGILYEHSHRLLGAAIGLMTIALSVGLFRVERRRISGGVAYGIALSSILAQLVVFGIAVSAGRIPSFWLEGLLVALFIAATVSLWNRGMTLTVIGLAALELVVLQGLLGGMTVVMRLPPLVSTIHLTIAMTLLAGTCYLTLRLHPDASLGRAIGPRSLLAVTIAAVLAQIVLGAFMRHTGSTLACGAELLTCQGEIVGSTGAAHTALAHRWFAMVVAALVVGATVPMFRAARKSERSWVAVFAAGSHLLVVAQIVLGFAALLAYVPVSLATVHQGVGAALLIDLVALYVCAGPWGARLERSSTTESHPAFGGSLSASR